MRRRYRPLNMIRTGSPTLEDRTKRRITRRYMRHLTSGATPPPIPLPGYIQRMMIPSVISDYEGLSTASWSSGTTGTIDGIANSSWNCQYYHATTANQRTTPIDVIMDPVRWSIACPPVNGGTYDWWNLSAAANRYTTPALGNIGDSGESTATVSQGTMGFSSTVLPASHFVTWQQGFAELAVLPLWNQGFGVYPGSRGTEVTLNALSANSLMTPRLVEIHAIRHRVNNAAVGTLQMQPPINRKTTDAWRVNLSPGDTYGIDVWYRLYTPNSASMPTTSGKAFWYIPTTRVTGGSRRPFGNTQNLPVAAFRNADFSAAFNYREHTYNITISGHTGYTLKDGSDGPHKMVSGGGWIAVIQNGRISWEKAVNDGHIWKIVFDWYRECPHVEIWPGPLNTISSSAVCFYRPSTSGYRTTTSATGIGTITHAPAASINQAGTTDFFQCPTMFPVTVPFEQFREGRTGVPPAIQTSIPSMITLTRTTQ